MNHLYLRFALLMMVIFTAAALFVRAQPYDDHELRALLLPEACEIPCFLGIRPGLTTADEAVKLLSESGWVDQISEHRELSFIHWIWNGSQPAMFPTQAGGGEIVFSDYNESDIQVVERIILATSVPLGYASMLFEKPSSTASGGKCSPSMRGTYVSTYTSYSVDLVASFVSCPVTKDKIWQAPMTINFMSQRALQGQSR